jgi:hypothetical protein
VRGEHTAEPTTGIGTEGLPYINRLAREFQDRKELVEVAIKRMDAVKKELSSYVDTQGTTDDKGNRWVPTEEYTLKRERRVSRVLDGDAVEQWAREANLWGAVSTSVEMVDENKLLSLGLADPDLNNTINSFYTERETWAFKVSNKV